MASLAVDAPFCVDGPRVSLWRVRLRLVLVEMSPRRRFIERLLRRQHRRRVFSHRWLAVVRFPLTVLGSSTTITDIHFVSPTDAASATKLAARSVCLTANARHTRRAGRRRARRPSRIIADDSSVEQRKVPCTRRGVCYKGGVVSNEVVFRRPRFSSASGAVVSARQPNNAHDRRPPTTGTPSGDPDEKPNKSEPIRRR